MCGISMTGNTTGICLQSYTTIIKRKFKMNIPFYTMTKKGLKIWQMSFNNSLMTHLHQFDYLKPYTPLKAEHFE